MIWPCRERDRFWRVGMERAHRCGATPLADRAFEELRAAGRAGAGADALTASERRVAGLAAGGVSNPAVSAIRRSRSLCS